MDINEIDAIFKKLGNKNKVRIIFNNKLQRNVFEKIVKRFIYAEENGGLQFDYEMKTDLIVEQEDNDYFLFIDGKNEVKKYWHFSAIPENSYLSIIPEKTHNEENYGMTIQLFEEDKKDSDKDFEKIGNKTYKYRNYYKVKDAVWGFDTNLIEIREILSDKSFKDSGCLTATPDFCIELLFSEVPHSEGEGEFMDYFKSYLQWLTEEIQQTNFIISVKEKESLLNTFKKLTKHVGEFTPAEPVEVLRRNFHRSDKFANVRENYAATYQIKGEPRFLFVSENFSKNVDGKIFMITQDLNVINTGKMLPDKGFENSLLEGYYSEINNAFYITDILFYKGHDVRSKPFFKLGAGAKEKYRYDELTQFYKEAIQKAQYVNPDLRDESTKILGPRYLFGDREKFDENVNELFENEKTYAMQVGLTITGLQFRPMDEPYPMVGGHWYSLFKWSYPEFRTAEFLVSYVKEGVVDKLSPFQLPSKGKDLFGKIIYYKTLKLKVGGYRDVKDKKIFTVVDYLPRGTDPQAEVNLANIPLDDAGKVVARDGNNVDEIMEDYVVEFAYTKIYGEYTSLFKWNPVRVNFMKTLEYKKKKKITGITETYGNHIWNALANEITKNNLMEGTVPEEDLSQLYYANNSTLRKKKYPFQIFHNRIVKDELITSVCPAIIKKSKTQIGSLLDLACGTGGDVMKWKMGLLKKVVGIDVVRDNILTAIELYKQSKRPKPDVSYIWGDSSKLIFPEFEAALDYQAKEQMKKTFLSKYQYDVVSLQFAIHYMCEDEIALRTLLQNVTDNLKIGGYFIGTSLDGERVYDLMKGLKAPAEGMVGDDVLWRISKNYTIKKWEKSKPNLGHEIEVYVNTIGIPHKEYLVNYDYLRDLAKEYGLEMVSIKGFGQIYEESMKQKTEYDLDLRNMSSSEKEFSFLHNEFKFEKTKDASDAVYTKLLNMISKKFKRDERLANFDNKKITIKVKSGGKPIKTA